MSIYEIVNKIASYVPQEYSFIIIILIIVFPIIILYSFFKIWSDIL